MNVAQKQISLTLLLLHLALLPHAIPSSLVHPVSSFYCLNLKLPVHCSWSQSLNATIVCVSAGNPGSSRPWAQFASLPAGQLREDIAQHQCQGLPDNTPGDRDCQV